VASIQNNDPYPLPRKITPMVP